MMKRKVKKLLALLMTLALVLGMLPLSVLADTGSGSHGQIQMDAGKNPLYYAFDPVSHQFASSGDADPLVVNSTTYDRVKISKEIAGTGTPDQFKITLKVDSNQRIEESTSSPDAAVVLVIDVSTSMDWCSECGGEEEEKAHHSFVDKSGGIFGTPNGKCDTCGERESNHNSCGPFKDSRLNAAKESAKDFLKTYAGWSKDANGNETYTDVGAARKVSIVAYSNGNGRNPKASSVVLDWTDLHGKTQAETAQALNNANSKIDAVDSNNYTDRAGTNTDAGLKTAETQMGKDAISTIKNRFVLLLTDGAPNANSGNLDRNVYKIPDGYQTPELDKGERAIDYDNPAKRANKLMTEYGAEFYSICFGWDKGFNWLNSFSDKCENAKNADELAVAFESIIFRIRMLVDAWKVNDTMGANIQLAEGKNGTFGKRSVTVAEDGNSFTWDLRTDLKNSTITNENGNGVSYKDYLENPDKTYHVTYALSYYVTLDTAAKGFVDKEANGDAKYYLTNGETKLNYFLEKSDSNVNGGQPYHVDADGNELDANADPMLTMHFKVPKVMGVIPQVPYTINYWKLDRDGTRPTTPTDTGKGEDALWTTVNPPAGYATRYSNDNYTLISTASSLQLTSKTDNVLDIEYTPDTTNVTVKHFYKDITIDADGNSNAETVTYGEPVVQTDGNEGNPNAKLYVGDKYTVGAEGSLGLNTTGGYAVDSTNLTNNSYTLKLDKGNNIIEIYYSRTTDNSEYNMAVTHTYNTYDWLPGADGRLVKTLTSTSSSEVYKNESPLKMAENPTKTYETPLTPQAGNETFAFVEATGSDDVLVDAEKAIATMDVDVGDNKLNLIFEYVPQQPKETTITVEHYYTNKSTTIVNGAVSSEGSFKDELGTENTEEITDYRVGDTYHVDANYTYGVHSDYTLVADSEENLSGTVVDGMTIKLYYTRSESPASGTLTVNHVFRNWEKYTIPGVDGAEDSFDYRITTEQTVPVSYPVANDILYAGQYVSVGLIEAPEGFAACVFNPNAEDSGISEVGENVAAENNTINVYYDATPEDNRDEAEVTIIHHYATLMDTVINGEVMTGYRIEDGTASQLIEGQVGDAYDITEQTSYTVEEGLSAGEHEDYECKTAYEGTGILKSGNNATIHLYYERTDSNLGEAIDYTVNYEYYEQTMEFNGENKPGWGEPALVTPVDAPVLFEGTAYANEKIELVTGAGTFDSVTYKAVSDQISMEQTITLEGENVFTLKYLHQTPKTATTVQVQHHYTTTTIDKFGGMGAPVTEDSEVTTYHVFVGEDKTVNANITAPFGYSDVKIDTLALADAGDIASQNDETKDITVTGQDNANGTKVDFYYSRTIDNSEGNKATWTVNHLYRTLDWNDSENKDYDPAGNGKSYSQTGTAYGDQQLDGTPNYWNDEAGRRTYELDGAETSGEFLESSYSITMIPGENTITFYYTNRVDTRSEVTLLVKHVYTSTDTFQTKNHEDGTDIIPVPAKIDGAWNIWVGEKYAAQLVTARVTGTEETQATTVYDFVSAEYSDKTTGEGKPATALEKDTAKEGYLVPVTLTNLENQTITVLYHRDFSTSTSVTVNHLYNTYDSYTGVTTPNTVPAEAVTETGETNAAIYVGNSYTPTEFAKAGYTRQTELSAIALAEGANVIDITYLRTVDSTPTSPTQPGGGGGGGGDDDDDRRPVGPTEPRPNDPEIVILPDDVPLAEIPEEEVPLAALPEPIADPDDYVILDEETPLGNLPQTGSRSDSQRALSLIGFGALTAMAGAMLINGKKREEEK